MRLLIDLIEGRVYSMIKIKARVVLVTTFVPSSASSLSRTSESSAGASVGVTPSEGQFSKVNKWILILESKLHLEKKTSFNTTGNPTISTESYHKFQKAPFEFKINDIVRIDPKSRLNYFL